MILIKTYNDLLEVGEVERDRMDFVLATIKDHKGSEEYKLAVDAELYYAHQNPTIMNFQKFVYNQFGKAVPDIWSANNKIASNWHNYFTTQAVSYLLGNGVSFKNEETKERLGDKFDRMVEKAAIHAKNARVSFGFWNLDHLEVFTLNEFAPLLDEEDGGLKAGVRFWQIDDNKPLRATLYELNGYTDYIKRKDKDIEILHKKRAYKEIVRTSEVEGEVIIDGENYPGFPIVPLWNVNKQSDLAGNRGTIDAYDLMISGLVNNVSDGEFIYWILKNCGGMDAMDDAKFIEQLKLTHVAHADGDDGAEVEGHNVSVEFQATAEALDRLERQLFKDYMGLKVEDISAGATNDQIQSAYEPLNQKTDQFEYCVNDFIMGILELAGIEDEPTYTRSQMSNRAETLDMVLQSAEYLDDEYVTQKILTLLGDADKAEEVQQRKVAEMADRYHLETDEEVTEKPTVVETEQSVATISQGDQYRIPLEFKNQNGENLTTEDVKDIEVIIGNIRKTLLDGGVGFDSESEVFYIHIMQEETFTMSGIVKITARILFANGDVVGVNLGSINFNNTNSKAVLK